MRDKLRWFVEHFEEVMGALILALMTLFAFLNVLTRYLIRYSFAPSEEIEVNALVWITMFGAAAAFKRGSHLKLIFLNRYVGKKISRLFWLFGRVLAVGVFSLLIYHGLAQAKVERELGIISEALSVPQWCYTLLLPALCLLVIVRILQEVARDFRTRGGG
jgi:TRAP-type C4-dicarboxylate transport system permease small subunit